MFYCFYWCGIYAFALIQSIVYIDISTSFAYIRIQHRNESISLVFANTHFPQSFRKYISTARAAELVAREIIGDVGHRTVVIGAAKTPASSPIKGYVRANKGILLKAIENLPSVDVL